MSASKDKPRVGLRDWWILLPVLSLGILTWAALFYVGLRARKASWLIAAAVYLTTFFAAFGIDSATGGAEWSSTLAGFVLFALMGGGLAHCIAIRRAFYTRISVKDTDEYDAAMRRMQARELGRELAADDPARARQMGVGRPDLPGSFDAQLVDLNSASAKLIASVCGVSAATAERVVTARDQTGDFSSVEDLDLLVDLPTHEVARLKDTGVCVPRY